MPQTSGQARKTPHLMGEALNRWHDAGLCAIKRHTAQMMLLAMNCRNL
jgi:hypothetical protein